MLKVIRVDHGRGDLVADDIASAVELGGPTVKDAFAKVELGGHTVWNQSRGLGGVDFQAGATIYLYQSGEAVVEVSVATQPGGPSVDDLMRALFDAFPPGGATG